jgi:hypothetical protein
MAAWGGGPFDNDDAMDFVVELVKAFSEEREQLIRGALALPAGEVERPEAFEAVAAAALVAAANGMKAIEPPEVAELVKAGGIPVDRQARDRARKALSRVVTHGGGWREQWEKADMLPDVEAMLEGLRAHL